MSAMSSAAPPSNIVGNFLYIAGCTGNVSSSFTRLKTMLETEQIYAVGDYLAIQKVGFR